MDADGGDLEDMAKCLCSLKAVDVEILSPPRPPSMAHALNLRPGFCIDLTAQDQKDEYRDLSRDEDQHELEQLQGREKPEFHKGSPPFTDFCKLLRIKLSKQEIEQRQVPEGKPFVRTFKKAYWRQLENGCHLLHDIPQMQNR